MLMTMSIVARINTCAKFVLKSPNKSLDCLYSAFASLRLNVTGSSGHQVTQKCGYARPPRNPYTKPVSFDYAGELMTQEPLSPTEILWKYREIKELQNAPESVRRLFTVEYASGREKLKHRHMMAQERMNKIVEPDDSLEPSIVRASVIVRNMIPHIIKFRHDKRNKRLLVEQIQRRRKLLKFLKKQDYERFIWLLKDLKVKFINIPAFNKRETRKGRLKRLAQEESLALKRKKIEALKQQLAEEHKIFQEQKKQIMNTIEKDITNFNLDKELIARSLKQWNEDKRKET
ncbi:hypothetical protein CHS0354_001100 [Potamilus streckersoni]|uniref:Small ribosomal subunit protein uS15m n=1 Tax=Potamilus streckersoni TaxID=2493646 RepID=A0AAE0VKS9_9BIVA|nr:hypothetical protein CHS0354_001100 [Potamilus streckersoni]